MTRGDILFEQINKDMISAMKSKDALTLSTLRMLKGAIDLERINKKLDCVSDDDIITIISKQIKTRKESILEFRNGNRDDLISKTNSEIEILERYMPEMLSESEVENEVDSAINEVGATTIKDMGSVMKVLSSKLKGRADMTLVSSIIKNKLK